MKRVAVVTHKFVTLPDDEMVFFLNTYRKTPVTYIKHSFSDAPDRCSYVEFYDNGVLNKSFKTIDYKFLPEPLIYIKEFIFTLRFLLFTPSNTKFDLFIGMDGLCTLFGLICKLFGKVEKVVYWSIDFVPKGRFKNPILDKIYHFVNTVGYKKCDELWDLSPRMKEARHDFLGLEYSHYKNLKIVPYGVWVDRIKKFGFEDTDINTLVFMGHLIEKQGVQLIISALPLIRMKVPDIKLKIIGTGEYEKPLITLAKDLGVRDICSFIGKIPDHKVLEQEIARSSLALAPYIKSLDKWTYYADPGKVKTYLACGVPVLLTPLPWNSEEIVQKKCGILIQEDPRDICEKVVQMLNPELNNQYRSNAIEYSKTYNYFNIFNSVL